jgi:hypothetical protein
VTRARTLFWAYVRVSTAGGELGDLAKGSGLVGSGDSELAWGPYHPREARRFAELTNERVRESAASG